MSTREMYLNNLDRLTAEMMGYVCDHLCRYTETEPDEESLEGICEGCEIGGVIRGILDQGTARTNETEKRP